MLKLILADNQAIFRAGIAKVLAVEDEMRIVAQAQTQEEMFMALDKFRAAVLILAGGVLFHFSFVLPAAYKNEKPGGAVGGYRRKAADCHRRLGHCVAGRHR